MYHAFRVFSVLAVILFAGCYPRTKITGSWKNPSISAGYHTVFVAALTGNTVARSTLEKEMAEAIGNAGAQVITSLEEFPPGFSNDSISKTALMERVKQKSVEAILTISIQKKETESRYVGGTYAPMSRWDYYGNFWGYYNYWWPSAYNPGYYQEQDVYYLETNLYDAKNELLVWSGQSRTYSVDGLAAIAGEFALTVAAKMKSDGVIR